jgi:hypothetical protein
LIVVIFSSSLISFHSSLTSATLVNKSFTIIAGDVSQNDFAASPIVHGASLSISIKPLGSATFSIHIPFEAHLRNFLPFFKT